VRPDHDDVGPLVGRLVDGACAETPGAFLARGRGGRDVPGLYSWWVDDDGAHELSAGLGVVIDEGLIYVGLAGATRWPSGRRSSNTLWSRISGMHLGGNQDFSTLRLTLASVLASGRGEPSVAEKTLTHWMTTHLRVATVPVDDPDELGRIEKAVLSRIDPPLNLQSMTPTPARRRLKELRRALARADRSPVVARTEEGGATPSATDPIDEVLRFGRLLKARNAIDAELGALMGRPMASGHPGEWLAARLFPIELERSASAAGIDGRFVAGPLTGRTVNVKWYLKREGVLDLTLPGPDYYLVLAGPRNSASSSRGHTRPWCVESVYLFDAGEVIDAQRRRGVKIGTASSVPTAMWDAAEIFPRAMCPSLTLDDRQRDRLSALEPDAVAVPPLGS
jgi:hypothetical protein